MNIDHGTFVTHDTYKNPIVVHYTTIKGQTDNLTNKIRELSPLFIDTYVNTEMEFAQKHPESIATDFMLKTLAPFAKDLHAIDWQLFGQKLQEHMHKFFMTMDWKAGSKAEDEHIFVVAYDSDNDRPLGALQFFTSPAFPQGSIKAALFGIKSDAHNRGIEQLLMSAIFKIRPDIRRIFLHTRATNQRAIDQYLSWGFVIIPGKMPHWTDMEYCVEQSDVLQRI